MIVRPLAAAACLAIAPASAFALVSIDFGYGNLPTASGVATDAAAANDVFQEANVWNALVHTDPYWVPTSSPSLSNLNDSSGAATGINFSLTGDVSGYGFGTGQTGESALDSTFLFFNSRGLSIDVDFSFSGLEAGMEYALFVHAPTVNQSGRSSDILVDTDGDGDLADETAQRLTAGNFITGQADVDAYIPLTMASASGTIFGSFRHVCVGSFACEVNIAGLQLAQLPTDPPPPVVPVPASAWLLLGGLGGLEALRRRRKR